MDFSLELTVPRLSLVYRPSQLPEHHEYAGDTSLLRRTALEPITLAFRTALKNASEDTSFVVASSISSCHAAWT